MSADESKKPIEPEDSGLYSGSEQDRLEGNHRMRDDVISEVYKGLKGKSNGGKDISREARLLKELLDSSDASTHKLAENRTKFKSAEAQGDLADSTAALLLEISRETAVEAGNTPPPRLLELKDDVIDIEIVDGETSNERVDFRIEDFTEPDKKD